MKLKTVKDIKKKASMNSVEIEDIKKEAIKWVKKFKELEAKAVPRYVEYMWGNTAKQFMEFHNITDAELEETNSTEEDLK